MQATKLAGPEAASQKYDLLTALGCHALSGPAGFQRLALRFITLVTARYNWRRGQLCVGQREIAQLWAVDERTVKREMAKLRALGWIRLESPGHRGRVASYALDLAAIRAATAESWERVGPDFAARMRGPGGAPTGATVVPFPRAEEARPDPDSLPSGDDAWERARMALRREDTAVFTNWFEMVRSRGSVRDTLILAAPSAFHATYIRTHFADRLLRAVREAAGLGGFRIEAEADRADGARE